MFCSPSPTGSMINDIKLPSFTELVTSIEECSNCSSPISGGASSLGSPHSYSSEREIRTEQSIVEPSFFHTMLPRIIRNDVNIPAPQFPSMAPLMVSTTQLQRSRRRCNQYHRTQNAPRRPHHRLHHQCL